MLNHFPLKVYDSELQLHVVNLRCNASYRSINSKLSAIVIYILKPLNAAFVGLCVKS